MSAQVPLGSRDLPGPNLPGHCGSGCGRERGDTLGLVGGIECSCARNTTRIGRRNGLLYPGRPRPKNAARPPPDAGPVPRGTDWLCWVNEPLTEPEPAAHHERRVRGRPFSARPLGERPRQSNSAWNSLRPPQRLTEEPGDVECPVSLAKTRPAIGMHKTAVGGSCSFAPCTTHTQDRERFHKALPLPSSGSSHWSTALPPCDLHCSLSLSAPCVD